MKTLRVIVVSWLVSALPACTSERLDYSVALEMLLTNPSAKTYLNWKEAHDASLGDCRSEGGFNNEKRARLFRLIRDGSVYALQAGMFSFRCWGGGELGDFYRSTGMFFDQNPQEFMRIAQDRAIPSNSLVRMIAMLPLELVDNVDGQLVLIERRVSALRNINSHALRSDINQIIHALEEHKTRLEMARTEISR